eukprot:1785918-Rhodomonas_salina.1
MIVMLPSHAALPVRQPQAGPKPATVTGATVSARFKKGSQRGAEPASPPDQNLSPGLQNGNDVGLQT